MRNKYAKYKRIIYVRCKKCDEWIDEDTVESTNIEEDFFGRDKLTFVCPTCKTESKSLRRG